MSCKITETCIQTMRTVVMENDRISVSVLTDNGADIHSLIYKPQQIDILYKPSWGIRDSNKYVATGANSQVVWMDRHCGGWNEIFPSGGQQSEVKGVEMSFHGEASILPWDYSIIKQSEAEIAVEFRVRTARTPFELIRRMTLRQGEAKLYLDETIVNHSDETMDYMWGHHPTLGAPFLDEGMIVDIPATWMESQAAENEATRMAGNRRHQWPIDKDKHGRKTDFSIVPPRSERSADLAFLGGLQDGWYGVTNPKLGLGFGMRWPREMFPYVWYWQELRGSSGWPWYSSEYAMALEPFTSYDAAGLANCIKKGTAKQIGPRQQASASLIAVLYESARGIVSIDEAGNPVLK